MPYLGKSPSFGVRQRYQYTATAGQTTFSGTDTENLTLTYTDANFVDVYQNGVLLKGGGNDYTATSGTSVVLGTGATADDVIEIIVYDAFSAANFFSRTDSDSRYQATLAGIDDQSSSNDDQITITDSAVIINEDSDDVDFRVEGNGNANALFVDAGNDTVICGANTSVGRFGAPLEVTTHGGTNRGGISVSNFLASANDSVIDFQKSRNDTVGSHTIVQSGDNIGGIIFRGSDGSAFVDAASINGQVDGTPGSSDMPGRLVFFTTPDGASGGQERFRIANNGDLTATDTSIGSNSDERLKKNIADFTYDLEKFKQYKPKTFDWKNPSAHNGKTGNRGFLAQDVKSVDDKWVGEIDIPEGNLDYDIISDNVSLTSKLGDKDAMYISVIQQLIAKNDALEARIKKLEDG